MHWPKVLLLSNCKITPFFLCLKGDKTMYTFFCVSTILKNVENLIGMCQFFGIYQEWTYKTIRVEVAVHELDLHVYELLKGLWTIKWLFDNFYSRRIFSWKSLKMLQKIQLCRSLISKCKDQIMTHACVLIQINLALIVRFNMKLIKTSQRNMRTVHFA